MTGKEVERSSWQLQPDDESDTKKLPAASTPAIEASDFPKSVNDGVVTYDTEAKTITITQSPDDLIAIGAAYQSLLEKLNWKPTREGIKSEEYVFLTFGQGKQEIDLRARKQEGKAIIQIEGNGIAWDKPLPVAPVRISYEAWLRRNRYPTSLDLIEQYITEMKKIP